MGMAWSIPGPSTLGPSEPLNTGTPVQDTFAMPFPKREAPRRPSLQARAKRALSAGPPGLNQRQKRQNWNFDAEAAEHSGTIDSIHVFLLRCFVFYWPEEDD